MREFLAVAAVERGAAGELLLQAVQELLVAVLAAAERDETQVARCEESGRTSNSRSTPFCGVSRVTMPTSGVRGAAGMRSRSSSACLFSRLPVRSDES